MSRIRADKLVNKAGTGAPELPFGLNAPNGLNVTGVVTATSFSGNVTGAGINVTGVVTATSFSGDGSALTGIDATTLKDSGGNVIIQAQASGAIITGVVTATSFSGDGSNLSNTGSTLSAGSGTQRVVLTGQTSGTMTSSATNSGLTFNSSTGALSATSYSGSGANLTGVLKTDISNLPTLP